MIRSRIIVADVLDGLSQIESESVQCVVTSPPYWGLRDYGMPGQIGLEPTPQEHITKMVEVFREVRRVLRKDGVVFLNYGDAYFSNPGNGRGGGSTLMGGKPHLSGASRVGSVNGGAYDTDGKGLRDLSGPDYAYPHLCDGCRAALLSCRSARNDQQNPVSASPRGKKGRGNVRSDSAPLSLDASPLSVQGSNRPRSSPPLPGECSHCDNCGACLSVLNSSSRDASLCGRKSAYTSGIPETLRPSVHRKSDRQSSSEAYNEPPVVQPYYTPKLKPKDLCMMPHRIAIALQDDGWWVRSDVVWSKLNPMPESVTDRPTRSHEYVFLLAKSERYFYDAEAIREDYSPATIQRISQPTFDSQNGGPKDPRNGGEGSRNRSARQGLENLKQNALNKRTYTDFNERWNEAEDSRSIPQGGRNKRTVWTIPTEPYADAHFATFPTALVKPCVLAGTSEKGCCAECGAPWVRVVERGETIKRTAINGMGNGELAAGMRFGDAQSQTLGWRPSCSHDAPTVGCLILDPFMGSGTVGLISLNYGRRFVGIEINPEYAKMAEKRIHAAKSQELLAF